MICTGQVVIKREIYNAVSEAKHLVESRLDSAHRDVFSVYTEVEKAKLMVSVRVLAPEKTRRAVTVDSLGDYFSELTDDDESTCAKFIADTLKDSHYCCKKGYRTKPYQLTYWLQPDWKYFFSTFG